MYQTVAADGDAARACALAHSSHEAHGCPLLFLWLCACAVRAAGAVAQRTVTSGLRHDRARA